MKSLLKFITCGSVDDGKSTLIGHILYAAKLLYADQEKALELDSKAGSREGAIDYSLLLDGLMAEREQGITIDVAYRYFTTERRSFIVADTPGHEEYTRNMAVGASFADLAIILVDATQGVLIQTKRHARICALMGIRYFVFAVNKMDLISYDKEKFDAICVDILQLAAELSLESVKMIPVSATEGDNMIKKSEHMTWYQGDSILTYLEEVDVTEKTREQGFYMPIQRVCRPNHTFRGFQGQIESGNVHLGDTLTVLPGNQKANVKSILTGDRQTQSAEAGMAVTIQLDKEVDVSRGCILENGSGILAAQTFQTILLWMDDQELSVGKEYVVKIGTRLISGTVTKISYKIDVNTGDHHFTETLEKNEIASCRIMLDEKIPLNVFSEHKTLGELILIDRVTNMTSACGVVKRLLENDKKQHTIFAWKDFKVSGDLFAEFYYHLKKGSLVKDRQEQKPYTLGDIVPVKGQTYEYPENFDILALKDHIAVRIRAQKVDEILPLGNYAYDGAAIVDERGFAIQINAQKELECFLESYEDAGTDSAYWNQWVNFNTYRKICLQGNDKEI